MPEIVDNRRQELFANFLARGLSHYKAYKEAGYRPNSKSASQLAQNPLIVARVQELKDAVVAQTTLSIQKVLGELEKLGFSNMLDYVKIDQDDGSVEVDLRNVTREQAAAIGEITTDVTTNPRTGEVTKRVKFKLLDKKGALLDLGRYLGMFVDRKEVKVGGVMFHINKEDSEL